MDITTIITVVVGSLCSLAGIVSSFLYYRQTKVSKDLENDAKRIEEWRKLYEESKLDSKIKDEKIDRLYTEIREREHSMHEVRNQHEAVKLENMCLTIYKCNVAGCSKREPKSNY